MTLPHRYRSRRKKPKLCPKTLHSVAKELRQASKNYHELEMHNAKRGSYAMALMLRDSSTVLRIYAEHFEGQAKRDD
jgi:hypothetical protein